MYTTTTHRVFTDLEIFQYYLGEVQLNVNITSPLRDNDSTPSFVVFCTSDCHNLRFKDFGTGIGGDAVEFVKRRFNLSYKAALEKINIDLSGIAAFVGLPVPIIMKEKNITTIKIRAKPWTSETSNYWQQFGISAKTLKLFNVYPIDYFWINEHRFYTKFGFAYYFGKVDEIDKFKLYFPFEEKRFITNCSTDILQGYDQLPWNGKLCIISKSLKDVMVLHECEYSAIATSSESHYLDPEKLFRRFDRVIVFWDADLAGIEGAKMMNYKYALESITVPEEPGIKDLAEYRAKYGYDKTKDLLKYLLDE